MSSFLAQSTCHKVDGRKRAIHGGRRHSRLSLRERQRERGSRPHGDGQYIRTNPCFEVDVGTAVDEKARYGRVAVVCRYVQRRKTALKHTQVSRR